MVLRIGDTAKMRSAIPQLLILTCIVTIASAQDDGYIIRKNQRTLQQIEEVYDQMKPVEYRPPKGRWRNLRRTRRLLRSGGELNVVMLGDSIVNDTSRSCWNLVLEKLRPKCKINKVTCVRGSTGCWWYKQTGRVKRFVLDHEPDLVIIGGISHRGDVDSIREMIRQIRAGAGAEVLLMTGSFGTVDPLKDEHWEKISDPNHYPAYRKALARLAETERTGFLDIEAAWARYVRNSGKKVKHFKRDAIHANEKGEQILGRILAAYLRPRGRGLASVKKTERQP